MTSKLAALKETQAHIMRNADKYIENDLTALEFGVMMGAHESGICLDKCVFCQVDRDAAEYVMKLMGGGLQ